MKTLVTKITLLIVAISMMAVSVYAQQSRDLQYFRAPDKTGINIFEAPSMTDVEFNGVNVRIGGSNTLQFQALDHATDGTEDIFSIGPNFNLATSNLDIDAQLAPGMRMHLRTYMSSRHHAQPYVKGGYLQVDQLDFIEEDFLADYMQYLQIKFGHMEINYGDAHFRRSDNGQTIHNPFVGNLIMDAFTTEVGGEILFRKDGWLAMAGMTNGKLNQNVIKPAEDQLATHVSLVGKLGFDRQINEDLRVRLTGSVYHTGRSARTYLYAGDRAGSRYYNLLTASSAEFRIPRFNPEFNNELTSIMVNPFVRYKGLEFFGVIESASGKAQAETDRRTFNQYAADLLYRFGNNEDYYFGGRYNVLSGDTNTGDAVDITRFNIGGGWFMTKNVLTKVEYVSQQYDGFSGESVFNGGEFNGLMIEAVVSF